MDGKNVDDYIQQGIYGKKELKAGEKKKYLGTFRERVIAALYLNQVCEKQVYPELIELMKEPGRKELLLNAQLDYNYLKKYVEAAGREGVPYKLVLNNEAGTSIGLILASADAIDKEDIYLKRPEPKVILNSPKKKKPSGIGRLLKKSLSKFSPKKKK